METRLTVELVPSTCWYTNLRSNVPKTVWDRLRRQVAADAGHRVSIALTHWTNRALRAEVAEFAWRPGD